MEYAELYKRIEEKIVQCRERYEKDKDDSYLSHTLNSELETLEEIYEYIRKEKPSPALEDKLKKRLCELEEAKEREDYAPSFSWYGEHYHYLVLKGACDAYQCIIGLLEEEMGI